MTDEDAEVLPFPGRYAPNLHELERDLDDAPVRSARLGLACEHRRSEVSSRARTVTCRDCGVALDPIDVLSRVAADRERIARDVARLRSRRDGLLAEVENLEVVERRAKARIRRARSKREDSVALEAAARASWIGRYQEYEDLTDYQRRSLLDRVRSVVEAYLGALP